MGEGETRDREGDKTCQGLANLSQQFSSKIQVEGEVRGKNRDEFTMPHQPASSHVRTSWLIGIDM